MPMRRRDWIGIHRTSTSTNLGRCEDCQPRAVGTGAIVDQTKVHKYEPANSRYCRSVCRGNGATCRKFHRQPVHSPEHRAAGFAKSRAVGEPATVNSADNSPTVEPRDDLMSATCRGNGATGRNSTDNSPQVRTSSDLRFSKPCAVGTARLVGIPPTTVHKYC
ncbi:hypothetical protein AVEN_195211-1 [Araneus ventricosus]|uniref:Uncharacterized protein n=1 Tax=Araneus ventricosus TaxID=182803 RepID=A0A4Y2Q9W6_ARAVE|nr:hypothetical protein AVEN_195211-1 [Araneus ventricosus]